MTEINELLAKLKELDPETFDEWRYVYRGNWEGAEYKPGVKLERTDLWLLRGVIQETIESNGYFYDIFNPNFDSSLKKTYRAVIRRLGCIRLSSDGDTPAEALLRAYITALEAES